MDATDLWGHGHPEESMKRRVFDYLNNNPDEMYTAVELRGILTDAEMPDFSKTDSKFTIKAISLMTENTRIKTALERLVDEEKVEKRLFEVDQIARILEDAPEDDLVRNAIEDHFGDNRIADSVYYRVAAEFR